MTNFLTLLDHTLNMNPADGEKSDEEEEELNAQGEPAHEAIMEEDEDEEEAEQVKEEVPEEVVEKVQEKKPPPGIGNGWNFSKEMNKLSCSCRGRGYGGNS